MNPPHTSARAAAEQYADEVAANTFDDSYTGSEIRAYYKFMTSAFEAGFAARGKLDAEIAKDEADNEEKWAAHYKNKEHNAQMNSQCVGGVISAREIASLILALDSAKEDT